MLTGIAEKKWERICPVQMFGYLSSEGALHHFREHQWFPELMDRSGWKGSETDELVVGGFRRR